VVHVPSGGGERGENSMSELFHIYIHEVAPPNSFSVTGTLGDQSQSEAVIFTPTPAYAQSKKRLAERRPALGLVSLDQQDPVCIQVGTELFNNFFTGSVLQIFKQYRQTNDPPRVGLHLARSLYREPWELLRDPDDALQGEFLSLIGSVIRFDAESGGVDPKTNLFPPARSLKCLFLSPRPMPTQEQGPVLPIEPESGETLAFEVISPPTYSQFVAITDEASFRPDGFIFFGHGKMKDSIGHLVFVIMQRFTLFKKPVDDLRTGGAVSLALAAKKSLRFTYLMACETAWIGEDDSIKFEDTVAGSLLSRTRMGFVIAAQLKIDFYAAQDFLFNTLAAIQSGTPLDLATTLGRKNVRGIAPGAEAGSRAALDWWVPVLYAKSTVLDIVSKPQIQMPELTRSF
jgi:hypothetical protein